MYIRALVSTAHDLNHSLLSEASALLMVSPVVREADSRVAHRPGGPNGFLTTQAFYGDFETKLGFISEQAP